MQTKTIFKELEGAAIGTSRSLPAALDALGFNANGLLPAIAQDADSDQVLMLAWMDRTAVERTLASGYAWYYSRSRRRHWQKGESSGHVQRLVEMRLDCDGDAILLRVRQQGPACHTNRQNCFYLLVDEQHIRVTAEPVIAADAG